MAFADLSVEDRIRVVNLDFMKHPVFCRLAGYAQTGEVFIVDDASTPTAKTDGFDAWYNREFAAAQSREQLRYLVAHENVHKALHHCINNLDIVRKYPQLAPMAHDYVVNQIIEDMDPGLMFVARPTLIPPLIDPKYKDMSWLEVLQDLIKQAKQGGGKGAGKGGQTLDQHVMRVVVKKAGDQPGDGQDPADDDGIPTLEITEDQLKQLEKAMADAKTQGDMLVKRLRGDSAGGRALSGFVERQTDYRPALRQFLQDISMGDDLPRFCPPNKRLFAAGFLMPSHFTETAGDLIVACDTSASMGHVYGVVFGEIARLCQQMQPAGVRVLWWDTKVAGDQRFEPKDYDKLAKLMRPKGGGGTTVSCVADYVAAKQIKAKAIIYMTDGEIEHNYRVPDMPALWVAIDNQRFVPRRGKVLHIFSAAV